MLIGLFSLRIPACCARPELNSSLFVGLFSWGLFAARMIVDYFQDARGSVKGEWEKMVSESLVMCIDDIVNVVGAGVIVERSAMITEEQVSRLLLNQAETRAFYHADFLSDSRSAPETVVFSRATHSREKIMANVGIASRGTSSVNTQSGQVNLRTQGSVSGPIMLTGRKPREVIFAAIRQCAALTVTFNFKKPCSSRLRCSKLEPGWI